ncbi:hypothetical protein CF386_08880 [Paraphotobacterium marinum]|uniref:HTH lysR-type domain-containing protein n=1 Tax=Paraphotobacterium marinum TaxID=1755811 RepID=A0A220VFL1_9GAMM|nr:LysR family transcriptional regulator [Paraphotobacterium marinum]ASK79174.1 hypothetical protein CF386_08880 [Paraphotobacterium marinum]
MEKFRTFITVANERGFSNAAIKLNISKATVSRHIREIEAEYGARLFNRTTRQVSLNEQGEIFYQYSLQCIELYENVHNRLSLSKNQISGRLKVGIPLSLIETYFIHKIPEFLQLYPEINLDIIHGHHTQYIHQNNFDIVIDDRILGDIDFYATELAQWKYVLCATPNYLKNSKKLKTPNDILNHQCIDHTGNLLKDWKFIFDNQLSEIFIDPKISLNNSFSVKEFVLNHFGLAYLPSYILHEEIKSGRLISLLESYLPMKYKIHALYTRKRSEFKKIDAFLKFLEDICADISLVQN